MVSGTGWELRPFVKSQGQPKATPVGGEKKENRDVELPPGPLDELPGLHDRTEGSPEEQGQPPWGRRQGQRVKVTQME